MRQFDVRTSDGRTLHAYDTVARDAENELAVVWHHGTPNIGLPPAPLFSTADRLGIRWISYDRPGYGGSTYHPGRDVASAAADVTSIADALDLDRFAVMGHSGGSAHAVACGAMLGERVAGVVSMAGIAPYEADGLDWFAGMATSGVASLRAAAVGREAKEQREASGVEYDPEFTPADLAALSGEWSWLNEVVAPAVASGPGGLIDDDLAYVAPWRFDLGDLRAPTLFVHGGRDRVIPSSHSAWLARRCPSAELWLRPDDGHISVLNSGAAALEWLHDHAR